MKVGREDAAGSPVRHSATTPDKAAFNPFVDSMNANDTGAGPYPRGPPMTDLTNIHSGSGMPSHGSQIRKVGELSPEDERELV